MELPKNGKNSIINTKFSDCEIKETEFCTKLKIMLDYLPYISRSYIKTSKIEPDMSMINEIVIDYVDTNKLNPPIIGIFINIVLTSAINNSEYKQLKSELLDFDNEKSNEINIIRTLLVKSNKLKERLDKLIETKIIDQEEYVQKANKIREEYLEKIIKNNKKSKKSKEKK